jgi:hypothetical protein
LAELLGIETTKSNGIADNKSMKLSRALHTALPVHVSRFHQFNVTNGKTLFHEELRHCNKRKENGFDLPVI